MKPKNSPGLGELLRYVGELVEQGADEHYRTLSLNYRARYTPVLRALQAGAQTVTDITACTYLSQGAVSQTVALLENDGIITRHTVPDGRKSAIQLTERGWALVAKLEQHWVATFAVIAGLEQEIGHPLLQVLEDTAHALERQGFSARLTEIKSTQPRAGGTAHVEPHNA